MIKYILAAFFISITGCSYLSMEATSALDKRCPNIVSVSDSAIENIGNCAIDISKKNNPRAAINSIWLNLTPHVSAGSRCEGGSCETLRTGFSRVRSKSGGDAESVTWQCTTCGQEGARTQLPSGAVMIQEAGKPPVYTKDGPQRVSDINAATKALETAYENKSLPKGVQ